MDQPERTPDQDPTRRPTRAAARPQPADPAASSSSADQLTTLAHELGNILDGSLRCLGLAERALPEADSGSTQTPDEARRKLDVVRQSLHRMSELVDAAMKSKGGGARHLAPAAAPVELAEAIFHAVDVLSPAASEHGVRITTVVSNGLSGVPAGTLYPVIINGLSNAIDAVAAARGPGEEQVRGNVEVEAGWTEDGRVRLTIRDDGVGLPSAAGEAVFRFGFSTKPHGAGVGLAVARSIVEELPGGTIRLLARADRPASGRPGAIFEVSYRPVGEEESDAAGAA